LGHAQPLENQDSYFTAMRDIYGWKYGCECKDLKTDKLINIDYVKELINRADIIYEWWWDTSSMITLWKETWFDKILKEARESGKVMCWLSAWANCWFEKCSSNALKKYGDNLPLIKVNCLWFLNWLFVPHADEPGRLESVKELLAKEKNEIWILLSNCAALVVVDDKCKIVTSPEAVNHWLERAFWKKTYRRNGEYIEETLDDSPEFKELSELYSRL
jgi:peptidase E